MCLACALCGEASLPDSWLTAQQRHHLPFRTTRVELEPGRQLRLASEQWPCRLRDRLGRQLELGRGDSAALLRLGNDARLFAPQQLLVQQAKLPPRHGAELLAQEPA